MTTNFLLTGLLLVNFFGCGTKNAKSPHQSSAYPDDNKSIVLYDLSKPSQVWNLPESLIEVSGIAWVDENHWLLIEDLHPNLYLVRFEKESVVEKTIPFVQQRDEKFD